MITSVSSSAVENLTRSDKVLRLRSA